MESNKREALGEFEHQVLLTILRLGGESYTVPIILELEGRTGKTVAPAAVYIALRRLEKKGLLKSKKTETKDKRERRYFKLRAAGLARLKESRKNFTRLWEGLEPVLEEQ